MQAYFPPISSSEGLPIIIQDVKGKEWTFQFRFWPNNNSRMYVLEGVTPCIQNMQLQAGDTGTLHAIFADVFYTILNFLIPLDEIFRLQSSVISLGSSAVLDYEFSIAIYVASTQWQSQDFGSRGADLINIFLFQRKLIISEGFSFSMKYICTLKLI